MQTVITPSKAANTAQANSEYYCVYSYQYVMSLVNQMLQAAYDGLNALVTAAGKTLPSSYVPIMTIDTTTTICTLNCPADGYDDTASNYIQIWFNPSLFFIFSSLPILVVSYSDSNKLLGKNMRIVTESFGGSSLTYFPPANPTYQMIQVVQECNTITTALNPVASFVVTSASLSVLPTNIESPSIQYNGQTFTGSNQNSATSTIITDFVSDNYRPWLLYEPTAEYQFHDIQKSGDLKQIDLQVLWLDKFNNNHAFYVSSGGTFYMKILWSKKGRRFPKMIAM